jgi:DNA polymerase-3 subunit gamma/tau
MPAKAAGLPSRFGPGRAAYGRSIHASHGVHWEQFPSTPNCMSYQVLARKWRPRNFAEMVGQAHVVRALSNALDNDRLHHAYLFTGTRGVGKTTLARILAKSLNCETGVSSKPCGVCSICKEIDEGRFADLLEVDAASRTKVDQTRELLENVPYAPVRGRYKVYLIDEVHMFSDSSFNALLKTLEEPPPHVKFLLATTDPQKVPVTVLSRCLQFNLKRLPVEQIQGQFEHILTAEGIVAEPAALGLIARAADGSLRDGLSLLDQAIAFGGGEVKEDEVRTMLGAVVTDRLPELLALVHAGDAAAALGLTAELAERAPDFAGLLRDFLLLLHRLALLQAVPGVADPVWGDVARLADMAAKLPAEDIQLYYQIALIGQRDLPLAPDPRAGFEMLLLRMIAFRPDGGGAPSGSRPQRESAPAERSATAAPAPTTEQAPTAHGEPVAALAQAKAALDAGATAPTMARSQPQVAEPAAQFPAAAPASAGVDLSDWHQVLARLELGGLARELAANCAVGSWAHGRLVLNIDPAHAGLAAGKARDRLQQALESYTAAPISLEFAVQQPQGETPAARAARDRADRQAAAEQALAADPLVKILEERFDGELLPDSIKPAQAS